MVYIPPTPFDFQVRFPEFSETDEGLIQILLDEAGADVGETWAEDDRAPATLYLAAHLLSSGGGVAASGAVKRRKVGDVETEFAGMSGYGLNSTSYGQRFAIIRRRNFPPVLVV